MNIKLQKVNKLAGTITAPADKSITHRAVMLSSISCGNSIIKNYLPSDDCLATIAAFRQMGAQIKQEKNVLYIKGKGLELDKPQEKINAGNSGTTTRLLSGILSGQNFTSSIFGDESLSKRPMKRIIEPLSLMGAKFQCADFHLPMTISGKNPLKAIEYQSNKASAQVKSAVLFAGLYADAKTIYTEPAKSRDHSERMLAAFGAEIKVYKNSISIYPAKKLNAQNITIPGDISSAAFFIAAALIVPNSNITIKNVGVNKTRDGMIEVLRKMGADIEYKNISEISGEPVCDINVKYSKLKAADAGGEIIPKMIDEIPIFALIASRAQGKTKITGAKELRAKESDRIKAVRGQFEKIGIDIKELDDGFIINGDPKSKIKAAVIDTYNDHRIAMTLSIAALICEGEMIIKNSECVKISFPNFYEELKKICL
jgi:3-phosphoshikimate 1-carboxyvinyltransferase